MSGSFGGKVSLTGESEYRKAIQNITTDLSKMSKGLKAQTSAFASSDKSVTANAQKQEELVRTIEALQKVVNKAKSSYAEYSTQLTAQQARHNKLNSEYKKAVQELDKVKEASGETSDEYKKQAEVVDKLEQELTQSTAEINDSKEAMANLKKEMTASQKHISGAYQELDRLKEEAAKTEAEVDDLGNESQATSKDVDKLGKAAKEAGNEAGGSRDQWTKWSGALANLISTGITAAINSFRQLGRAVADAWQEYDEGSDIIIAATGATGDAAEDLMNVYKNVSKEVVADYSEIGTAVGEVNTRFGTTGDLLQETSTQFLKFAQLNGVDVKTAIDNTQAAMEAFGLSAEDTSAFLDTLNKAGQDTGVSVDKLTELMMVNSPALKEMGFSASDAAMFLANLDKNGVDTSSTMAGLKKALANAAAEGKPMDEAMASMEDSIKNAKDSTEAITIATELFGTKSGAAIATAVRDGRLSFDELGTSMKDFEGNVNSTFEDTLDGPDKFKLAIQNIRTEAADMAGRIMTEYEPQISQAFDYISNTVMPKVEDAIGKILDIVDDLSTTVKDVGDFFEPAFSWIKDNAAPIAAGLAGIGTTLGIIALQSVGIEGVKTAIMGLSLVQKVAEITTKAQAAAQWLLNAAMNANPIGLVIAAIAGLVVGFVVLWNKSEKFRNFWIGLWAKIKAVAEPIIKTVKEAMQNAWDAIKEKWDAAKKFFTDIWEGIKNTFANVKTWFSNMFGNAWNAIKEKWNAAKSFFQNIWNGIKNVFSGVKTYFSNIFTGAYNAITNKFNQLKGFFSGLWGNIKSTFTNLGTNISNAIGGAVKSGLNGVVSMIENTINSGINLINGAINLINKLPGVNVGKIGSLSLPRLAKGGVVDKATIAEIGEDGAEAVVPLEKNTGWIRQVANELKTSIGKDLKNIQANNIQPTYNQDDMVTAFKQALSDMKIELDDEVAGRFIDKTVTRLIYN